MAHDTVVGDHCIFASDVILGGHVKVESHIFIGGMSCCKPFVRIGRGVYIGGGSVVDRDVPSFCTAYGNRLQLSGINIVGLRKQGFSKKEVSSAVQFYKEMEASESSPYTIAEKILESEKGESGLISQICQSIVIGKSGVTPFRREK